MERTDDVIKVWGHYQKARNFFDDLLEKLNQLLVDGFGYPIDPCITKVLNAVLLVDSAINVLN